MSFCDCCLSHLDAGSQMGTAEVLAGIVVAGAIVIAVVISRSRCRNLEMCGCIKIEREVELEHDIELSDLKDGLPLPLGLGGVSNQPHTSQHQNNHDHQTHRIGGQLHYYQGNLDRESPATVVLRESESSQSAL